ncbi:hypothetical protein CBS101457_004669 [Exobasidium rhododendri]|nr:hypothetical protein CBS101457_004669 [Exobasidium rhododendri]
MDHAVVQRWLQEVVVPYNDSDRVFADVNRTVIAVSSLSPKTEVYTYDDGRTQLLLILTGTIPINFRNASYNIPMEIWVPRLYPREAPIAYVRPTNDMLIRKSKNVDVSGRMGGDYLARWEKKWESCNLLDLLHTFQDIFGQEPPVYAKPKQAMVSAPASPAVSSSRGPADPRERGPPPPPSNQALRPLPSQNIVPMKPPKAGSSFSVLEGHQQHTSSPSSSSLVGWTVSPRLSSGGKSISQEISANEHDWAKSQSASSRQGAWQSGPDGHFDSQSRHSYDRTYRSASLQSTSQRTISSPSIQRSSLVASPPPSSAMLPAPPRPPNPELLHMHAVLHHKIQTRLQHLRSTQGEVQDQLRLLINDLDRGEPAIRDEMARLEAVRDVCRATGDGLHEAVSKGSRRIEELKVRNEPEIDGMICATSIVGNQLIDLVAADSAIGDTLFYLGQALHSEVIEVEKFLKQTRFLAREQFMRRALAQKISQGMGW